MDYLDLVREQGGEYRCPEDFEGRPIGPLVALEARYSVDRSNLETAQYVSKTFYNFAWLEQTNPRLYRELCRPVAQKTCKTLELTKDDYILSVPYGGLFLGFETAGMLQCRFAAAEKHFFLHRNETVHEKLPEPAVGMKYKLVLKRHRIERGARVVIADDVCNNFSVIIGLLQQVINLAKPIGIICMLNRSTQSQFICPGFPALPILSVVHQPTEQFRQDNPRVVQAVRDGRVCWWPRQKWLELLTAMNQHQ